MVLLFSHFLVIYSELTGPKFSYVVKILQASSWSQVSVPYNSPIHYVDDTEEITNGKVKSAIVTKFVSFLSKKF